LLGHSPPPYRPLWPADSIKVSTFPTKFPVMDPPESVILFVRVEGGSPFFFALTAPRSVIFVEEGFFEAVPPLGVASESSPARWRPQFPLKLLPSDGSSSRSPSIVMRSSTRYVLPRASFDPGPEVCAREAELPADALVAFRDFSFTL